MNQLTQEIQQLKKEFFSHLQDIKNSDDLERFRITYLGRSGKVPGLMPQLKQLSLEEKKEVGPILNAFRQEANQQFEKKKRELEEKALEIKLAEDKDFDVTLYKPLAKTGSIHPITQTYNKIRDIFLSMGYEIADGPEVENEYYNFESLNIPEDHPARDMWDTFWLNIPKMLLRTHTSSVQIHALEKKELPLAVIAPGRVYRHEATDATHDFMFNQLEGLVVAKNISLAHLLGTIEKFCRAFFGQKDIKIRVRPGYFPFVEPGVEIDMSCPFCEEGCSICKQTGWIEMAGAGLVHPHVLRSCKIDADEYSGFAFGFGIDRMTMLQYGINDIRLFRANNLAFLEQF